MAVVALYDELAGISEHWKPVVINEGDFGFRLVKFVGEFEWHCHEHSDKAILVVSGEMSVALEDGQDIRVRQGEVYVIKKGIRHKPYAAQECAVVLIEQAGLGE